MIATTSNVSTSQQKLTQQKSPTTEGGGGAQQWQSAPSGEGEGARRGGGPTKQQREQRANENRNNANNERQQRAGGPRKPGLVSGTSLASTSAAEAPQSKEMMPSWNGSGGHSNYRGRPMRRRQQTHDTHQAAAGPSSPGGSASGTGGAGTHQRSFGGNRRINGSSSFYRNAPRTSFASNSTEQPAQKTAQPEPETQAEAEPETGGRAPTAAAAPNAVPLPSVTMPPLDAPLLLAESESWMQRYYLHLSQYPAQLHLLYRADASVVFGGSGGPEECLGRQMSGIAEIRRFFESPAGLKFSGARVIVEALQPLPCPVAAGAVALFLRGRLWFRRDTDEGCTGYGRGFQQPLSFVHFLLLDRGGGAGAVSSSATAGTAAPLPAGSAPPTVTSPPADPKIVTEYFHVTPASTMLMNPMNPQGVMPPPEQPPPQYYLGGSMSATLPGSSLQNPNQAAYNMYLPAGSANSSSSVSSLLHQNQSSFAGSSQPPVSPPQFLVGYMQQQQQHAGAGGGSWALEPTAAPSDLNHHHPAPMPPKPGYQILGARAVDRATDVQQRLSHQPSVQAGGHGQLWHGSGAAPPTGNSGPAAAGADPAAGPVIATAPCAAPAAGSGADAGGLNKAEAAGGENTTTPPTAAEKGDCAPRSSGPAATAEQSAGMSKGEAPPHPPAAGDAGGQEAAGGGSGPQQRTRRIRLTTSGSGVGPGGASPSPISLRAVGGNGYRGRQRMPMMSAENRSCSLSSTTGAGGLGEGTTPVSLRQPGLSLYATPAGTHGSNAAALHGLSDQALKDAVEAAVRAVNANFRCVSVNRPFSPLKPAATYFFISLDSAKTRDALRARGQIEVAGILVNLSPVRVNRNHGSHGAPHNASGSSAHSGRADSNAGGHSHSGSHRGDFHAHGGPRDSNAGGKDNTSSQPSGAPVPRPRSGQSQGGRGHSSSLASSYHRSRGAASGSGEGSTAAAAAQPVHSQ